MLTGRHVAIIGAGIGGLSSAIAMAQRGAHVRVFEQAHTNSKTGAGIQITPNGVAVLDALGLAGQMRRAAVRSKAVVLRDYRRGKQIARLNMAVGDDARPYLLLHRSDLIDQMTRAAQAEGVEIYTECNATAVHDSKTGAEIEFLDSTKISADLVVGADGLHSRLRPILNKGTAPFFTGQMAWRAVISGAMPPQVNLYMGPGRHIVTYPLRGRELINIVAVQERDGWADDGWHHAGDPDLLRRSFSMFCPEVRWLLDRVQHTHIWGLFRHPVAENWHGINTALLGDAAHPTLPFLAQGANMALEDAWVLADCLAALPTNRALTTYQHRRRDRVMRVIDAADTNARNYHLRQPAIRYAAHSVLRFAGAFAPRKLLERYDWIYQQDVTLDQQVKN